MRSELSKLSDDERAEILRAVGLGPGTSKRSSPKEGREQKKAKPKESSAERRARRARREQEEAGLVPKLSKGVRVQQQRKAAEAKKSAATKAAAPSFGTVGGAFGKAGGGDKDKGPALTRREGENDDCLPPHVIASGDNVDHAEEEKEEEEELWEEVGEEELSERDLAFFSDSRLAGEGSSAEDAFLKSIFGDSAGLGRGAGAADVQGGTVPAELKGLVDEKRAKERVEKSAVQKERRLLVRDDGGGDRDRFHMLFPDEAAINPYDPQTFGYLQVCMLPKPKRGKL